MATEFRILGEVEARRDGQALVLGSARPRAVLVALLLDANKPVSLDELVDRVWGEDAPRQARSSLHSYFTRLRSALGTEAGIVRRGPGYALHTEMETIDLHRFRRFAALARSSDEPSAGVAHSAAALQLWRGEPFAGLDSTWLTNARTALRAEHESLLLDHTDAHLELGRHAALVTELALRAEQHPLNERLAAQLMLALYRSDRHADALVHFQKVRTTLADELGTGPGPALRALHESILREDPALKAPAQPRSQIAVAAAQPAESFRRDERRAIVPRQLPSAPRSFTAREDELATLSELLEPGDGTRLAMIAGSGGMGKTSLALHWAHHHAELFPDGQLFVDLRGFEPSSERVSPYDAMRTFLLAFQIDPHAIPDEPEAMTGLYRSVLADKRVLLVVDNARDTGQVTALLPASAGCSVIVTSRNRLTSLVTSHNATLLALLPLGDEAARGLLVSRLGAERSSAEPAAVEELVTVCGGLPLALSITVGRAQEHPEFSLASLVTELHDAGSALNALDFDDGLSIRAVLSTSYAALSAEQAEVFRLLSAVPGPDIDLTAASALIARSYAKTRTLLRELERASLLHQHSPGRFRMHDLVHAYGQERAEEPPHAEARVTALRRVTSLYLHTAISAETLIEPNRPRITVEPPPEGCLPIPLSDADQAWRWFTLEEPNVRAVQRLGQELGWHAVVWQLTWAITNLYTRRGQFQEGQVIWEAALAAGERLGSDDKVMVAHRFLAVTLTRLGDNERAIHHANASLALVERSGNPLDRIFVLTNRAEVHWRSQRSDLALADARLAWQLAQDQVRPLRLRTTSRLAWHLALDGQYGAAREMAELSLTLLDGPADGMERATIIDTLGYIALQTGQLEQALSYLHEAADCFSGPGEVGELASTLFTLGKTYSDLGRFDEARNHLEQALKLYREHHRIPDVRHAEAALRELEEKAAPGSDRPSSAG